MNLLINGEMLTDTHISAALNLLKLQYPDVGGLQEPILGQKFLFDLCPKEFVQILHDGSLHWVTVSNILSGSDDSCVALYDSLYVSSPVKQIEMQVASIIHSQKKKLSISWKSFRNKKVEWTVGYLP